MIGPSENGWTVLSSMLLDSQDMNVIKDYSTRLSSLMATNVVTVVNHDDDVLWLFGLKDGDLIATFHSDPGYFSGEDLPPQIDGWALFAETFGEGKGTKVDLALVSEQVFAIDRHGLITKALGLPEYSVGFGFGYAQRGELDDLELLYKDA